MYIKKMNKVLISLIVVLKIIKKLMAITFVISCVPLFTFADTVDDTAFKKTTVNMDVNTLAGVSKPIQVSYHYSPPAQLDDGITTANLNNASIDTQPIFSLMNKALAVNNKTPYQELHSLLIYKDGALVLEEYFSGNNDFIDFEHDITRIASPTSIPWQRHKKHYVASVNKALTATLAGIALNQFKLSVDEKISLLLPHQQLLFADKNKSALTFRHLLTMQLGFTWDEWTDKDLALLWQSSDFTHFLLSRHNDGPGLNWVYNSAGPNLLLTALDNLMEEPIREWADKQFYEKLGITDYLWESQPTGIPEGSARMYLRPRDMLKIGMTYLQKGQWQGEQVIPQQWVKDIFTRQSGSDAGNYSYYFWLRELNGVRYISADGDGGQYINIFPDQDMVIVMTQGNYLEWPLYKNQADDIMGNYIFPALIPKTDATTLKSVAQSK